MALFSCIQRFAMISGTSSNRNESNNLNLNLVAISMFMNAADFIARLAKDAQQEETNQSERQTLDVDRIWLSLFTSMQSVGREPKLEIRRSLIQTLENMVKNHSASLSKQVWSHLLDEFLLTLLSYASRVYSSSFSEDVPNSQRSITTDRHSAFIDQGMRKALMDNDGWESWGETCLQLISTIYRAFKVILVSANKQAKVPPITELSRIWLSYHNELLQGLILKDANHAQMTGKFIL